MSIPFDFLVKYEKTHRLNIYEKRGDEYHFRFWMSRFISKVVCNDPNVESMRLEFCSSNGKIEGRNGVIKTGSREFMRDGNVAGDYGTYYILNITDPHQQCRLFPQGKYSNFSKFDNCELIVKFREPVENPTLLVTNHHANVIPQDGYIPFKFPEEFSNCEDPSLGTSTKRTI